LKVPQCPMEPVSMFPTPLPERTTCPDTPNREEWEGVWVGSSMALEPFRPSVSPAVSR
jgi:hypothetical protein